MNKIFYIGNGLMIEVNEPKENHWDAVVSVNGLRISAIISFENTGIKTTICPKITLHEVVGPRIPIDVLYKKIGQIIQNYDHISRVMGAAWFDGAFNLQ